MVYQFIVFLQLLFWLFLYPRRLKNSKFEFEKNKNFKQDFKTANDFGYKSHQQQSCRTHQDLQLLFWSFLHPIK